MQCPPQIRWTRLFWLIGIVLNKYSSQSRDPENNLHVLVFRWTRRAAEVQRVFYPSSSPGSWLHVLVLLRTRTCRLFPGSEDASAPHHDQDMHTPNSPLGFACPGSPENQDMQPLVRLPKPLVLELHLSPSLDLAIGLGFACPGSQEDQDMQTPVASWGYACPDPECFALAASMRCTVDANTARIAICNTRQLTLCDIRLSHHPSSLISQLIITPRSHSLFKHFRVSQGIAQRNGRRTICARSGREVQYHMYRRVGVQRGCDGCKRLHHEDDARWRCPQVAIQILASNRKPMLRSHMACIWLSRQHRFL